MQNCTSILLADNDRKLTRGTERYETHKGTALAEIKSKYKKRDKIELVEGVEGIRGIRGIRKMRG